MGFLKRVCFLSVGKTCIAEMFLLGKKAKQGSVLYTVHVFHVQ